MNKTKTLGLYIHIPFCKRKCQYCIFYSTTNFNIDIIDTYINTIIIQIKKYSSLLIKNYYVDTIYFGGGSPSSIPYKYINVILENIYKFFNVNNNVEITLECNPEDLSENYIKELYNSPINRISLGVQSAIYNELKLLNRNYNINDIYNIIKLLNSINIKNISIDLIYAIPNQKLTNIMYSINESIKLNIQHISIYNFEPNNLKLKKLKYPSEILQFKMYKNICKELSKNNFQKYEIANFSKQNFSCKHNEKYWNLNEYLGLGAGAHSFLNGKRFSNNNNLSNFSKNIIYDNENINLFEDYIMLKIRTNEGINLEYIYKRFNAKINLNKINFLLEKKLLYKKNNNYILTLSGSFIINKIIYEILVT